MYYVIGKEQSLSSNQLTSVIGIWLTWYTLILGFLLGLCYLINGYCFTCPQGYKLFFMLNSTEQQISTADKTKILTNEEVSCFNHANKC